MFTRQDLTSLIGRVLIAMAFVAGPHIGEAAEATGTWEGKVACKGLDDGAKVSRKGTTTVKITQSGNDLNVDGDGTLLNGSIQDSAANPNKAKAIFINCETNPDLAAGNDHEMGIADVIINGDQAVIKFTSVSLTDDGFLICTGSLKRTSIANPAVPTCP